MLYILLYNNAMSIVSYMDHSVYKFGYHIWVNVNSNNINR